MTPSTLRRIVAESNAVEGITREPTERELAATALFLGYAPRLVTIADLCNLAKVYAGAELRDKPGMDVRVGSHIAPRGGVEIRRALSALLIKLPTLDPCLFHRQYEMLHPFTDGNGRTGRALWWLRMQNDDGALARGFLHSWYYQSLEKKL